MMSSEEERVEPKLSEIIRIGGYLAIGGALLGFSLGVYMLSTSTLFSIFINISQYEAMNYFLSVFMPSFVIIMALGYLFATTSGFKGTSLSHVASLCIFCLICMAVSALSMILYFLSFLGSFLVLIAVVKAYTRPTFRALSNREAFFLVEFGAMLVACFSALFLLVWVISRFLQTYGLGWYVFGYQFVFALVMVEALSFLLFFTIPLWGSRGTNSGLCGMFGLIVTIASLILVEQNQYGFFNASVYVGVFIAGVGLTLSMIGDLAYVKLFFSEPTVIAETTPSLLLQGKYCPYCGKPRLTSVQTSCYYCSRSLMWRPEAPFCSSCGQVVPTDAKMCPHCREDIGNKMAYFSMKDLEGQMIAGRLKPASRKKEGWMMSLARRMVNAVVKAFSLVIGVVELVNERVAVTLKESVYIVILTSVFSFVSFIGYKRSELFPPLFKTNIFYYGFPLEWLRIETELSLWGVNDIQIWWAQLLLDISLYFILSFSLVYGVSKLRR